MPRKRAAQTRSKSGATPPKRATATRRRSEQFLQIFIRHLFDSNWNATTALERTELECGQDPGDRGNLRRRAFRLLNSDEVKQALETHAEAAVLSASEVLMRVSDHARADIDDCYDDEGNFSLAKARERGVTHLVKSLTTEESPIFDDGEVIGVRKKVRAEIHDSQKALQLLMRYHHLLTEFRAARDLPKDREGLTQYIIGEFARVNGVSADEAQKMIQQMPAKES